VFGDERAVEPEDVHSPAGVLRPPGEVTSVRVNTTLAASLSSMRRISCAVCGWPRLPGTTGRQERVVQVLLEFRQPLPPLTNSSSLLGGSGEVPPARDNDGAGGSEHGGRGRVHAALPVRFNDLDVVFNRGS
jgi:hypothetical protein